jgi:hypothetical protein
MRLLLMALGVALMTGSAAAAEKYISGGLGTASCGAWTAARRDRQALGYEQWLLGFLSGFADLAASDCPCPAKMDPLRGVDAQGVWAWIDNFCRAHPLDEGLEAGEAFAAAHPHQ